MLLFLSELLLLSNLILLVCCVLLTKNPLHSLYFLILYFLNGSIIVYYIGFAFYSLIFIAIYVGAIAVLFAFVVMLLDLNIKFGLKNIFFTYSLPIILLVGFSFFFFFLKILVLHIQTCILIGFYTSMN